MSTARPPLHLPSPGAHILTCSSGATSEIDLDAGMMTVTPAGEAPATFPLLTVFEASPPLPGLSSLDRLHAARVSDLVPDE